MRNKIFTLAMALFFSAFAVNAQKFSKAEARVDGKTMVQNSLFGKTASSEKVVEKSDLPTENVFIQSSRVSGAKGTLVEVDFSTGLPTDWTVVDNEGNGQVWVFDNPGGLEINTATAGNGFAIIDSDDYGMGNSQNSDLISKTYDFSSNALVVVEFQHYYEHVGSSIARFSYSVDDGATWTEYQAWTATSANAELFSADMSAEISGEAAVKFMWHYEGSWSYHWAIDDINIYEPEAYMFAVSAPAGVVVKQGMSHEYVVEITNVGAASDNFTVASAGNGAWTYELLQADSTTALVDPITIAAGADSSFVIRVTLPAEGLTLGQEDMASFSVTSAEGGKAVESFDITTVALTPYPVPFNEDFATYLPTNWSEFKGLLANPTVTTGTTSSWAVDGFANNGTTGAARLNIYGTSANDWLTTPEIQLGDGVYHLSFDMALVAWNTTNVAALGEDDKFAVVVSTDGGATWNLDDTLVVFDNTHVFSLNEKVELDLSAYANSTIMIGFYGESTVSGNGDNDLSIDNVAVYEVFENDLSVTAVAPEWIFAGDNTTPVVSVKNVGALEQNDFQVDVVINDGTTDVYTSTKTISAAALAAGASMDITMDDEWVNVPEGEYSVNVLVTLADDGNVLNNELVADFSAIVLSYEKDLVYGYEAINSATFVSTQSVFGIDVFSAEYDVLGTAGVDDLYGGDFIGTWPDATLIAVAGADAYILNGDGKAYKYGTCTGLYDGLVGVTWDATTDIVYATDGTVFYSINEALEADSIGEIASATFIYGIASNSLGEMYGIGADDNLYSIDITTGAGTIVGPLGFDINFVQDIGFDRENDILYGTLFKNTVYDGGLYTIDVTTGAASLIGETFKSEVTVCAVQGNPQYEVTFSVTDGTDPVDGAEINVFGRTLTTDATGLVSTSLINGAYDYTVTAATFGPVFGSLTVADMDMTEDVVMEAAYDVTFTVTDGTDPIVGAAITINDLAMGVTDASGILVAGLSDGTYNYAVTADGYADVTGSVEVAGAVVAVDVTMDPIYPVTFAVVDEFGAAMEGATVTINGEDLTTDMAGQATIELLANTYSYTVNKDGYTEVTGAVDVVDAAVDVDVTMELIRYTITFNAKDNNDVVLAGVNIHIDGTDPANDLTTDASGVATLDTINGTYAYTATLSGYAAVMGEVIVADGDIAENVVFAEPAYAVTFTVTDGTDPIEGANVAVAGLNGLTDATGVVAFDLPAGDHNYTVTFAGYDNVTGTVTVVDAPVAVPTITMVETEYNVNFVVKDEWAAAVVGATVTIDGEEIATNASGVATFQRVAGTYAWTVVATGYDDATGSVEVINSNKTVNVEMIAYRYTATFTVENALGNALEGASIAINEEVLTTNATGEATIELPNGDYPYTVTAADYDAFTGSITVADGDLAEPVEMVETIVNPYGLLVEVDGTNANFSWNNSSGFFDDFEGYEDFVLEFDPWTLVDVDGLATYGFQGVTFTNSGAAMAGIIFNPTATVPALENPAHSGDKFVAVFNPANAAACNDWIISPRTPVMANGQVSFWATGGNSSYSAEQFQVAVSTTDTDPASFTTISPVVTCPAGSVEWVQYTYSLADYVGQEVYVGIHVTSVDQFYFCLDDFSISAATKSKAVVGYNVYLDGSTTPENDQPIEATSYLFEGLDFGTHTAGVEAVYATGTSEIVEIEFSIDEPYTVTFNVTDGTNPVEGASIAIEGETLITDAAGVATIALIDGTYNFTVTATGFEAYTDQVTVAGADIAVPVSLIGMGNVAANFSIYPNPTTGVLNVTAQGTNNVVVLNAIGQVVHTQVLNGNGTIDLSNNASGVYFVRFQSGNNVATQRVILE